MGYSTHDSNGRRQSRKAGDSRDIPGGLVEGLHKMFIELGVKSERRGERYAALELYKRAVATNPESPLAWYNYGDILLQLNRNEQAVDALSEAVRLDGNVPLYHYDLGLALHRVGRYKEAEKELAVIVDDDLELTRAASTLGLSAMSMLALTKDAMGYPRDSLEIFGPALKHAYYVIYNMARFNLQAKRPREAIRYFMAAEIIDPRKEEVAHGIGFGLMKLRKNREALVYLKKAVRLDAACQSAWYDLGVVYARLKMVKAARLCFRKARALNQKDPWPHYDLACLDALEGKPDAAFRSLKTAVARGYSNLRHIQLDADFKSIQADPRWQPLLKAIRQNRDKEERKKHRK